MPFNIVTYAEKKYHVLVSKKVGDSNEKFPKTKLKEFEGVDRQPNMF